jgi:hypothetical protein
MSRVNYEEIAAMITPVITAIFSEKEESDRLAARERRVRHMAEELFKQQLASIYAEGFDMETEEKVARMAVFAHQAAETFENRYETLQVLQGSERSQTVTLDAGDETALEFTWSGALCEAKLLHVGPSPDGVYLNERDVMTQIVSPRVGPGDVLRLVYTKPQKRVQLLLSAFERVSPDARTTEDDLAARMVIQEIEIVAVDEHKKVFIWDEFQNPARLIKVHPDPKKIVFPSPDRMTIDVGEKLRIEYDEPQERVTLTLKGIGLVSASARPVSEENAFSGEFGQNLPT